MQWLSSCWRKQIHARSFAFKAELVSVHASEKNCMWRIQIPVLSWSSVVKMQVEENAKDDCLWSEFYVIIITIEVVIRETI